MNCSTLMTIASVTRALVLAAGGALPAAGALAAEKEHSPAARVTVVRATQSCFTAAIRVTGFLVPREEAAVSFELPGQKVSEVLAAEGDKVRLGQTLARLIRSAEGPPEPAGAAARTTTTTLKAPANGVVTRSTAVVGGTASPMNEPLFRIAVESVVELEVDVPSIYVPELSAGQTARVEVGDGRELTSRVRLAPAEVDARTQRGSARLSLDNSSSLRIGMFARATIDAERSCGVSVPRTAVQYRTGGASVQVVRGTTVETRVVQVGLRSDLNAEIRDGLREGDVVVANAGTSLHDGDVVTAVFLDGAQLAQP